MDFKLLKRGNDLMIKFLEIFIAVIGTLLVITVVGNVACRYLLQTTIPWAEELARFTFIWVTFIGAVLANDRNEHMQLGFIVEALPPSMAKYVRVVAYGIVLILISFLIYGGIQYTLTQWDWMSSALNVRHGMVYMVAPICLMIMALQFLVRFVLGIAQLMQKRGEDTPSC